MAPLKSLLEPLRTGKARNKYSCGLSPKRGQGSKAQSLHAVHNLACDLKPCILITTKIERFVLSRELSPRGAGA